MAIKFLTKVGYNDIYQVTTSSLKTIKISVSAIIDSDNKELWKADIFIPELGEWKCFLTDSLEQCGTFDNFLEKLDLILKDD